MAGITKKTSFKLDGKTTVNVGEWGHFEWGPATPRAWMGPVNVDPLGSVSPGIAVGVTLAGSNWDMHTLRFSGGAQFEVKIRDNTKLGSEAVWIERIGLSHGPSDVVLKNASVRFINGGRDNDKITTGNSYVGYIDLNRGDNIARTGKGYVDAITAREGNDVVTTGDGGVGFIDLGHGDNTFTTGKGWVDALVARGGNDVATIGGGAGMVSLGHGNNTVTTGKGWVDSIVTRDGDDVVNVGGGGVGYIDTGAGNDLVVVSRLDKKDWMVTAQGGRGTDTVDFSKLSRGIDWNVSEGYAETRDGKFLMMSFENVVGTRKADTIRGSDGNNVISGGSGNDKITGGKGADDLTGGAGKDTFIFLAVSDSTTAAKGRDVIHDFSQRQKDKIDLRAIDAKSGSKKIDSFNFIGDKAFSGAKGQLRFEHDDGNTYVYGDINGDKRADFAIELVGEINLKKGDFVL